MHSQRLWPLIIEFDGRIFPVTVWVLPSWSICLFTWVGSPVEKSGETMKMPVSHLYWRKNELNTWGCLLVMAEEAPLKSRLSWQGYIIVLVSASLLPLWTSLSVSLACSDWSRCQDLHNASPYLITTWGSFLWDVEKCLGNSPALCSLYLSQSVSAAITKVLRWSYVK